MKIYFDEEIKEVEEDLLHSEALSFGYGIFETIKVLKSKPLFLSEHFKRMSGSAGFLGMNSSFIETEIRSKASIIIKENEIDEGALKIRLIKGSVKEHLIITADKRNYSNEIYQVGVALKLSERRRNEKSFLSYHKTLNYLENILEKREAEKSCFFDALFLNTEGKVAETAIANIFFVKGNKLFTPSIETGILPGVVRGLVLKLAGKMGIDCMEGHFSEELIKDAEGAFITNSLLGIMPVRSINNNEYPLENLIINAVGVAYDKLIEGEL